jgi:GNAT superfamily N-acetyltransferase
MKFRRPAGDPPPFQTELRVERIDRDHADGFARVVADGYGLGREILPLVASVVGSEGWDCYVAFADGEPAASGALFTSDGVGWLGMAATVAEFRRRGAQGTLLAARIARASELGCELLVTETGAEVEGRPSNSYRNIVRSGFEPAYLRPNYRAPA